MLAVGRQFHLTYNMLHIITLHLCKNAPQLVSLCSLQQHYFCAKNYYINPVRMHIAPTLDWYWTYC